MYSQEQLERALSLHSRLVHAGCDRIVVNLHHHAERISDFLAAASAVGGRGTGEVGSPYSWSGADILLSAEPGGGARDGGWSKEGETSVSR